LIITATFSQQRIPAQTEETNRQDRRERQERRGIATRSAAFFPVLIGIDSYFALLASFAVF
jgi:hypothetical protein